MRKEVGASPEDVAISEILMEVPAREILSALNCIGNNANIRLVRREIVFL